MLTIRQKGIILNGLYALKANLDESGLAKFAKDAKDVQNFSPITEEEIQDVIDVLSERWNCI